MGHSWTCPYCNRPCTIGDTDIRKMTNYKRISEECGHYKGTLTVIVCPNLDCRKQTLLGEVISCDSQGYIGKNNDPIYSKQLVPSFEMKHFPNYIPKQILEDYGEACLIRDNSPKASATLSRRCLQGMIRDFWKVHKNRLFDEINEIKEKVDTETWDAIDSVRQIGNIGAHMGKDVNLIIDVDPDEAGSLIWLIETLLQEWYVADHDRKERMAELTNMATQKRKEKKPVLSSSEDE